VHSDKPELSWLIDSLQYEQPTHLLRLITVRLRINKLRQLIFRLHKLVRKISEIYRAPISAAQISQLFLNCYPDSLGELNL
jgi:hypothetical protein